MKSSEKLRSSLNLFILFLKEKPIFKLLELIILFGILIVFSIYIVLFASPLYSDSLIFKASLAFFIISVIISIYSFFRSSYLKKESRYRIPWIILFILGILVSAFTLLIVLIEYLTKLCD